MHSYTSFFEPSPLLIILLGAVFVHACFQLAVSVLTLLSSHTIGRRLPNQRLLTLNFWYISGVVTMITLLTLGAMSLQRWALVHVGESVTLVTYSLLPLVALLMVLFYYRRGRGTRLWLPRPAASYITDRAKRTKSSIEAFALGTTTAVAELPFAVAPLAIVALAFQGFASDQWLRLALSYALAVSIPLMFVAIYLSSGHKVSRVQAWREDAKSFLNWTSAASLLLLALYLVVLHTGAAA
jgi:hypothetical protein